MPTVKAEKVDACPCGRVKIKIGKRSGWFSKEEAKKKLKPSKEKPTDREEPEEREEEEEEEETSEEDADESDSLFR